MSENQKQSVTKEELAEKAAAWWADKYDRPHYDNGDKSAQGGMAMAMAMMLYKKPTEETKEKFKKCLKDLILKELESTDWEVWVCIDYGPCTLLYEACKQSGMPEDNGPWKTNMVIKPKDGTIMCSYGYAQPYEII